MNPKFSRLGNRIINLAAIAEVNFNPETPDDHPACHIWYIGTVSECTSLIGAEAVQFWGLMQHYSMNITPVEETQQQEAIATTRVSDNLFEPIAAS